MRSLREDLCALLLLGASGVAMFGCGGGQTSATTSAASPTPTGTSSPRAGAVKASDCRLGSFMQALDTLESRLAAGLSYEQYFAEVSAARSAYEKVPVDDLDLPCLAGVGTPAEKALDQYIEAANVWRECRADVSCGTYTIEPRLQRKWRVASHYIAAAHAGHA